MYVLEHMVDGKPNKICQLPWSAIMFGASLAMPNIQSLRLDDHSAGARTDWTSRFRDPLEYFRKLRSLDVHHSKVEFIRCVDAAQTTELRSLHCNTLNSRSLHLPMAALHNLKALTFIRLDLSEGELPLLLIALPKLERLAFNTSAHASICTALPMHSSRLLYLQAGGTANPQVHRSRPVSEWLSLLPNLESASIATCYLPNAPILVGGAMRDLILRRTDTFQEGWSAFGFILRELRLT